MAESDKAYSQFENAVSQKNPLFTTDPYSQTSQLPTDLGGLLGNIKRTRLLSKADQINVVGDFSWKNGGESFSTEEVPAIILVEKTLSMTGIAATLTNVLNTAADRIERLRQNQSLGSTLTEPYGKLYVVEENAKGFQYKLPWLLNNNSNLRTISNVWNDNKGNTLDKGSNKSSSSSSDKIMGFIAGAAAGAVSPGMEIDPIFTYSTTNRMSITIKFPLYNTYSVDQTIKNFYLVTLLTYQNLKNRTSLVTYVPPSVYTVSSEAFGGIYMPVAVMTELKINNIGTVRQIKDDIIEGQTVLIPEAYDINITLQELIPQSTNIFEGAIGGVQVSVLSPAVGVEGNVTK